MLSFRLTVDQYGGRVTVDIDNYADGWCLVPLFREWYEQGYGYAVHESWGVQCRMGHMECSCSDKERDYERTIVYICVPGGPADQVWRR